MQFKHATKNRPSCITAGMDYALGAAVIAIDADLQDPPELILDLIEKWKEGFDVVVCFTAF